MYKGDTGKLFVDCVHVSPSSVDVIVNPCVTPTSVEPRYPNFMFDQIVDTICDNSKLPPPNLYVLLVKSAESYGLPSSSKLCTTTVGTRVGFLASTVCVNALD